MPITLSEIETEQFLWAVGSMAQLKCLAFSPEIFLHAYPAPHVFDQLTTALRHLGMQAVQRQVKKLATLKTPCLIQLANQTNTSAQATETETETETASIIASTSTAAEPTPSQDAAVPAAAKPQIALLIRLDKDQAWVFYPGQTEPQAQSLAALTAQMSGRVIECSSAASAVKDPDQSTPQSFNYAWFLPVLLQHKAIWRDVLMASFVIQLIALATPLFTQVVIDKVVVHQTSSTLGVIAVALLIFIVFNAALSWVRQYLILHTGNRVDAQLGTAVLEHLLHLPLRYFEKRPTGVIAARLHAVETIREFVASSLVTLLLDFPFLLIFVAIMFFYSVSLSLLVLLILGLIAGLSVLVAPLFRQRLNQQFMLGARNQAFLTEYIASLETVKSLQMEPQLVRRYRDYLATYLEAGFRTRQIGNTYSTVSAALEQLMTLVVLTAGAWIVMKGGLLSNTDTLSSSNQDRFTIGMLVAFQMFAGKLSQPLMRLVGLWQQFQQTSISVKRLADIMDAPTEPYSITPNRQSKREGRIEIIDLAFRYADDRPYLYQHLNLTLKAGSTSVLLGPSGSGKSTLAKLLLGFYAPSSGQILMDGIDIQHLAANELRAYFGVVPQETVLFSGTIYENLQVANPSATFEMLVHACKMAEIHTTIEALPHGYQSEIGERGVGLSGGQKQRIAIARALLKQPKILIFDEATSALDAETAEHFARTVNALRGRVAMLFITHQLPKSLQVDEVIHIGERALSVVSNRPPATAKNSSSTASAAGDKA